MNRSDAKKLGLKTFQSDTPCVHGHFAYRYTASGACSECVKLAANSGRRMSEAPRIAAPGPVVDAVAMRDWLDRRASVHLILDVRDLYAAREMVTWTCVARWPTLPPETFSQEPRVKPQGSVSRYTFQAHPDDHVALRAYGNALNNARWPGPVVRPYDQAGSAARQMLADMDAADEASGNYPKGDPR